MINVGSFWSNCDLFWPYADAYCAAAIRNIVEQSENKYCEVRHGYTYLAKTRRIIVSLQSEIFSSVKK